MSIHAYSGAAGCGKTYSVFQRLQSELEQNPLKPHQRVLAITFMHGARYRLSEQLARLEILGKRYEASTLDSFAWTICRRWTSRVIELGMPTPMITDFEQIATTAAKLVSDADIRTWITSSYPIILVDEAQDLEISRLQIIEELMKCCCVLFAFDEFQCLNNINRPVAVTQWIANKCTPTMLLQNMRTNNPHLLEAALQVRNGEPITVDDATFRIKVASHRRGVKPMLAAANIAFQFYKDGNFAILTPAKESSKYVLDIINILQTESVTKKNLGPFKILWEDTNNKQYEPIRKIIRTDKEYQISSIENLFASFGDLPVIDLTIATIKRTRATSGISSLLGSKILAILDRHIHTHKQHFRPKTASKAAMTIHQAKNREFDNVVIIWPFQIPTDNDSRRRLIYNAITRAKKTCLIIVQSDSLIKEAPFI